MTRTLLFTGVAAAATLTLALGATAETGATAPAAPIQLSIAQIATQLESQGYAIREIEFEHGVYDVEMIDANGMRVEAYLDPITGDALPRDFDDDDEDDRSDRRDDDDDDRWDD